jgi:hypothetical protein
MTPKERARLIDKQEFEAEAKAVRERALIEVVRRRREEHARIMGIAEEPETLKTERRRIRIDARRYSHDGKSLTATEWASQTRMCATLLRNRLQRGWPVERAITEPNGASMGRPRHKPEAQPPGVATNFEPSTGTGAGSTAQETSEITFSRETENA